MFSTKDLAKIQDAYAWFQGGNKFGYEIGSKHSWAVIADQGIGLLESLRRVRPSLKTSQEALDVAFFEVISGRAPERRGNGLKFVRQAVSSSPGRGLLFQSAANLGLFGDLGPSLIDIIDALRKKKPAKFGTFALLAWNS